jgi:hypothetical protein
MNELEDVVGLWDSTLERIHDIFQKKKAKQYPEGILLLGSIIEEFLRVLIIGRLIFNVKHYMNLASKEMREIDSYYDDLSLYQKIKTSFALGLIDDVTYKNLESFRKKRNKWIHDFCYEHQRGNPQEIFEISSKILDALVKKLKYYLSKM